jgi:hypothetical protein
VGEPLPRPEIELPAYGRSLLLAVTGSLMALVFLTATIMAGFERSTRGAKSNLAAFSMLPFDIWSWIAAAETASWRLKWAMVPLMIFVLIAGRKIYRSIQQSPDRFCGLRYARKGYTASVAVPLLVLILIGITVPERLRQRNLAFQAGILAEGHTWDRLFLQYREKFGTLPSEKNDVARLPDPDGSIARLLKESEVSEYKPSAEVAALPKQNPRPLRGAMIRNASLNTVADESPSEGLSFTNYELRLPGVDKIMNTEDDLVIIDGVTYKVSEIPRRGAVKSSTAQKRQP